MNFTYRPSKWNYYLDIPALESDEDNEDGSEDGCTSHRVLQGQAKVGGLWVVIQTLDLDLTRTETERKKERGGLLV